MQIICGIDITMSGGNNGKSNFPRRRFRKWQETDKRKQLEEEGKCQKKKKICHKKSRQQFIKKDVISFWRLGLKRRKVKKFVIGKSRKQLTKEGTVSFLEAQHKNRKDRKRYH